MPFYKYEFQNNTQQFSNTYPVKLPGSGNDGGKIGGQIQGQFYPHGPNRFKRGHNIPAQSKRVGFLDHPSGYLDLVIDGSQYCGIEAPKAPGKGVSVRQAIIPIEWFNAYFLPWQNGFIARMDLPVVGNVQYFFTGEMNGCAFLVAGNPNRPMVAHLNIEEPMNTGPNWHQQRQQELEFQIRLALQGKNRANAKILTKWGPARNTLNFEGRLIRYGPTYDRNQLEETTAIHSFDNLLLNKNKKILPNSRNNIIADIKCSMMGIKQGGAWRFFYQRVIEVYASGIVKKLNSKWKGFKKKIGGDHRVRERNSARIIIPGSGYNQFWP